MQKKLKHVGDPLKAWRRGVQCGVAFSWSKQNPMRQAPFCYDLSSHVNPWSESIVRTYTWAFRL